MAPTTSLSRAFSTLLATIVLSTLLSVVKAAPWPHYARHSTHRVRQIGSGLKVEAYHPKTNFKVRCSRPAHQVVARLLIFYCCVPFYLQTFGTEGALVGAGNSLTDSNSTLRESAMSYVTSLGFQEENVAWKSGFTAGDTGFAYLKQSHVSPTAFPFVLSIQAVCHVGRYPFRQCCLQHGSYWRPRCVVGLIVRGPRIR
jgi:extracellular elastinolytic metalloproteinase